MSAPTKAKAKAKKTTTAEPKGGSNIFTVELDGVTITVDMTPARNLRLIRRIKHDDVEALLEFVEGTFGDQLPDLEAAFGLSDIEDYNTFMERVMKELSPNS